jgi:hypothetical protein
LTYFLPINSFFLASIVAEMYTTKWYLMIHCREDFLLELAGNFRFVDRQRRLRIEQTALTRCCFTAACA